MTYDFAVKEATRRTQILKTTHYVVYSREGYMVLARELTLQQEDRYAVTDVIPYTHEMAVAEQHEEILAGLANERPHSRFRESNGNPVQWTYSGQRDSIMLR
jgi:hypothetical protein